MKYHITTYGCQFNYSDTERVQTVLDNIGFKKARGPKTADVVIFNTCSVRQKAEDRVHGQMINMREIRRHKNPNLIVGLTGCMVRKTSTRASEDRDNLFKQMKEIDFVFRIEDIAKLDGVLKEANPKLKLISPPDESEEGELADYFKVQPKLESDFQAFLPIMKGCDKFCTYCIVPYSRGREMSRPIYDIISEAEKMVENGIIQITLLGQTVDSYGLGHLDKKSGRFDDLYKLDHSPFVELLYRVDKLKEKGLKRLRYTSPHPQDMTDELIRAHAELETLMLHIHLPIQAGDNNLLKRMNRNYTVEDYEKIAEKVRKWVPNASFTSDIIVGFCGETDEEFQNTYNLLKKIRWDMVYHAQYSPRKGTVAAAHMEDDVPVKTKRQRWHEFNELLKECSHEFNRRFTGKTVEVLVERQKDGIAEGTLPQYKRVTFASGSNLVGKIVPVKITAAKEWILEGELCAMEPSKSRSTDLKQSVNKRRDHGSVRREHKKSEQYEKK